jgi:hypothetical protein
MVEIRPASARGSGRAAGPQQLQAAQATCRRPWQGKCSSCWLWLSLWPAVGSSLLCCRAGVHAAQHAPAPRGSSQPATAQPLLAAYLNWRRCMTSSRRSMPFLPSDSTCSSGISLVLARAAIWLPAQDQLPLPPPPPRTQTHTYAHTRTAHASVLAGPCRRTLRQLGIPCARTCRPVSGARFSSAAILLLVSDRSVSLCSGSRPWMRVIALNDRSSHVRLVCAGVGAAGVGAGRAARVA